MDFKTRLKERRIERGLTQDQLGEMCNASKSAVSQWENGGTMPATDTLLLLRGALNCSIDWLLVGANCASEDTRTRHLADLFQTLDERGKAAVFRVAEAESNYTVKPDILPKRSA